MVAALRIPGSWPFSTSGERTAWPTPSPAARRRYAVGKLADGALPARKAVDWQIARALAAAHEKGSSTATSREPSSPRGRVKVLDFGPPDALRRGRRRHTLAHGFPGTPIRDGSDGGLHVAGAGDGSCRPSVGHLLRGRAYDGPGLAFRGDTAVETMNAILKEDALDPTSLPWAAVRHDRIVRHCLEKSPHERFQSARDLAFDLETTGLSTPSAPSGSWRRRQGGG